MKMTKFAPVLLFVYNRIETTKTDNYTFEK